MSDAPILALPLLLVIAVLYLGGLALLRWRPIRRRWPGLTREWLAVGALGALNIGFFWRVLLTRDTWMPRGGGDFNSFYYPLYRYAAEQIAAGHFPLWNPHLWGGMPFAADQQTGLFSPLNLAAFLLASPFNYGTLEALAILQVWLASVLAYALCRELGVRHGAAIAGGVVFAYSGFLISHLGHYPMVGVAAWLPAALLATRRLVAGRGLAPAILLAMTLLLALLAGHQQVFLYLLIAIGLYWAFQTWVRSPTAMWPTGAGQITRWLSTSFAAHWTSALGKFVLALAVTVGLAAPALLPSLELARLSIRAGLSYGESTAFALRPLHLISLLVPNAFGSTPGTYIDAVGFSGEVWGYAGVIALGLAGLAFVRVSAPQRWEAWFWAGLALLALLLALGAATPLQGWFYAFVPGFSRVRASGRWLLLFDLAIAILAAFGLDNICRLIVHELDTIRPLLRRIAVGLGGVVAGGCALLALGYSALLAVRDPSAPLAQLLDSAAWIVLLLGLALVIVLLVRQRRIGVRAMLCAGVALVVLDLFAASASVPPTNEDPLAGFQRPEALAVMRAIGGEPFFRIDLNRVSGPWQPSWAALVDLESTTGAYDPLGLATYNRYWNRIFQRHDSPLYDLLTIRYLVFPPNEAPAGGGKFRELLRTKDYVIYENQTPLPRAFLVGQARPVATSDDAWNAITAPGFDPRAIVYLNSSPGSATAVPALDGPAPQGSATFARPNSDLLVVTVESDRPAMLVLSEVAYPGWRAVIDGQPAPLFTADYLFRAVEVSAGRHEVRLIFDPPLWRAGWLIAGLTACCIVAMVIVAMFRRRRARRRGAEKGV